MKRHFRIVFIVCIALVLGLTSFAQIQSLLAKSVVIFPTDDGDLITIVVPDKEPPKILNVPLYGQEQDQWCWAGTAQMIVKFKSGTKYSQCSMANYVRNFTTCCSNPSSSTCNYPTYLDENVKLYKYYGYSKTTSINDVLTFAQLKTEINAQQPFWWGWYWSGGGGHAMAVKGYGPKTKYVYFQDPWEPQSKVCTYDECVYTPGHHSWGATVYRIKN